MFTVEQIKEKMMQVRTGADFPVLAMNLKNLGVTYYETKMNEGSSIFHGENGYEIVAGPNYEPIVIADKVNLEQLKTHIANHQQGKVDTMEWLLCYSRYSCSP